MLLVFLPKGSGGPTHVFITTCMLPTLVPVDAPLFLSMSSLSLGLTSMFLLFLFPLKWVWIPYLLHMFLKLSPKPCVYDITVCPLVYLSLLVSLPSGFPLLLSLSPPLSSFWLLPTLLPSWLFLINLSILSKAHLGNLH